MLSSVITPNIGLYFVIFLMVNRSHLSTWHNLGLSMRKTRKHWGIRQKPKTELLNKLKLTTNTARVPTLEDEMNIEKLVDELEGRTIDADLCHSGQDRMHPILKMCKRRKQLLQFDKNHRPAFYGIWPTRRYVALFWSLSCITNSNCMYLS